ncbi:MAG: 23S rRNA (pseudouridine(1915)-N(3))-methyltransferase RlmH [Fusobacteriia bacterium 4572_132]|nr:MAG: 23S rRNA (pseudouridine(1915)-N(3))-methyltransferase RlmH [Fusobacteriia bacterium 4572_132]
MNINLICIGKIKEKYIINGINEFQKRMKAYAKFKIIELKEDGKDKNKNMSIEKESNRIKEMLEKNKGYNILLEIKGKSFSSEEMAKELQNLMLAGNSTINFIIGGSYGVSEEIKKITNLKLTFSKLTFPHQLMRLILLEQIYRWFNILNNGKYHK